MAKLKPCPFCGNKDVHITQSYPHYVYCLDCGMMVQLAGKAWEKDIPEIIRIWNTRIPNRKRVNKLTDKDIKIISEKIDSLHKKILESKFAEKVTESEMVSLILAVKELNRQKAEIERLEEMLDSAVSSERNVVDNTPYERAETIKEFAEKLKEYFPSIAGAIDYTVEELLKNER